MRNPEVVIVTVPVLQTDGEYVFHSTPVFDNIISLVSWLVGWCSKLYDQYLNKPMRTATNNSHIFSQSYSAKHMYETPNSARNRWRMTLGEIQTLKKRRIGAYTYLVRLPRLARLVESL